MPQVHSILLYGQPKVGKTLDVCFTFRHVFVLLTEPGGLTSVTANLGYTPAHVELFSVDRPFEEAEGAIREVLPKIKEGKISSIFLDTGSELAARMLSAGEKTYGRDARQLYPPVTRQFEMLMRLCLSSGGWFIMTCHKQEPSQTERGYRMGGPKLPGKLVENIPSMFSLILQADIVKRGGALQRIYRCQPLDPMFLMGDRYGVTEAEQPMQLTRLVWRLLNPDKPLPELPVKTIRVGGKLMREDQVPVVRATDAPEGTATID